MSSPCLYFLTDYNLQYQAWLLFFPCMWIEQIFHVSKTKIRSFSKRKTTLSCVGCMTFGTAFVISELSCAMLQNEYFKYSKPGLPSNTIHPAIQLYRKKDTLSTQLQHSKLRKIIILKRLKFHLVTNQAGLIAKSSTIECKAIGPFSTAALPCFHKLQIELKENKREYPA